MDIANRIKSLREARGLTQEQLAEKLSVSRSAIGMLESGKRNPSIEVLEEIADFFNVSVDYLRGKEDRTVRYIDPELADLLERESIQHVLFAGGKLPDEVLESYAEAMRYTLKALEAAQKK